MDGVRVLSTDQLASSYSAVLTSLRLLRALLASIAFSIVFVGVLGGIFVILVFVVGSRSVLLSLPWPGTFRSFALGVMILSLLMVFQVAMAAVVFLLYLRAARGSLAVAWLLLTLAALSLVGSSVDLVQHLASIRSVVAAERGTELLQAAQNLWPIYVALGFLYGSLGFIRIAKKGRLNIIFDQGQGGGRGADLYRLMGLPHAAGDRRQLKKALSVAWLAFVCEGVAFGTYYTGSVQRPPPLSLGVAAAFVVVAWPLSVLILYALLALAQWLWSTARRVGQPSLYETLLLDRRPPILFLRSFEDDQVSLKSARVPLYLRAVDPGVVAHRFEELLVFNYSRIGPVIAIGSPSDVSPPIGAAREYLTNDQWQRQALDYMARARAIVVTLSHTPGLAWELAQIRVLATCRRRCSLCRPPSAAVLMK